MNSFFILERSRTWGYRKTLTTIYFISFRNKGFENPLHYIKTPKQLILDFYDCKNDNFHLKSFVVVVVVVVFLFFFVFLKCKRMYSPV